MTPPDSDGPRIYRPGDPEYFHAPDSDAREVKGRLCDVCLRGSIPCAVDPPAWLCDLKWPSSREEHFRIGYERYRNGANGIVVAPDLAQRILAALEDHYVEALAAELRAVIGK